VHGSGEPGVNSAGGAGYGLADIGRFPYRWPRRALTYCPKLCMGIQPDAHFPARSADALPTTLYGHCTQAICRDRPIARHVIDTHSGNSSLELVDIL